MNEDVSVSPIKTWTKMSEFPMLALFSRGDVTKQRQFQVLNPVSLACHVFLWPNKTSCVFNGGSLS